MRFERMLVYKRPDDTVLFDVHMKITEKETVDGCFYKLFDLLKAYFGSVADLDSQHKDILAPTAEGDKASSFQQPSLPHGQLAPKMIGYVPHSVMTFFRQAVQEKMCLVSEQEAEEVLKRLFGVNNLKDASRHKALDVLEMIALGHI